MHNVLFFAFCSQAKSRAVQNDIFTPTPEQRQAIEHVHGPMLVVAGAGTGKTTVLARRIAHLIKSEAARPDEILAVTYTRNSAAELIHRVAAILYPNLDQQPSLYPELERPKAAKKLLRAACRRTPSIRTAIGYCRTRAPSFSSSTTRTFSSCCAAASAT